MVKCLAITSIFSCLIGIKQGPLVVVNSQLHVGAHACTYEVHAALCPLHFASVNAPGVVALRLLTY